MEQNRISTHRRISGKQAESHHYNQGIAVGVVRDISALLNFVIVLCFHDICLFSLISARLIFCIYIILGEGRITTEHHRNMEQTRISIHRRISGTQAESHHYNKGIAVGVVRDIVAPTGWDRTNTYIFI